MRDRRARLRGRFVIHCPAVPGLKQVRADANRVFELRVYHTVPGKASALQSEFRDKVTKMFAKHDLKAVGYWAPEDAPASDNTFIYILAHPSRDEAKKHWAAFQADPAFQEMMKSQQGRRESRGKGRFHLHGPDRLFSAEVGRWHFRGRRTA